MILFRIVASELATLGVLVCGCEPFCVTLEEPWRENKRNVSCIPAGSYDVVWSFSPRFRKRLPILKGVPERKYIRIHSGNSTRDTEGCILLGREHTLNGMIPWITESRSTFERFRIATKGDPFRLKIVWACDSPEGIICES